MSTACVCSLTIASAVCGQQVDWFVLCTDFTADLITQQQMLHAIARAQPQTPAGWNEAIIQLCRCSQPELARYAPPSRPECW